jgi:hypothetical protein
MLNEYKLVSGRRMSMWTGNSLRKATSVSVGAFALAEFVCSIVPSYWSDSLHVDLATVIILVLTPAVDRGRRGSLIALLIFMCLYLQLAVTALIGNDIFSFTFEIGGKPGIAQHFPGLKIAAAATLIWTIMNIVMLGMVLGQTRPRACNPPA